MRVGTNPMVGVLLRRGKDTQRYTREGHVKMDIEIGVINYKPRRRPRLARIHHKQGMAREHS